MFGVLSRSQFEATRAAWAELKWQALEAVGVDAATCAQVMTLHEESVQAALCHTRFPLHTTGEMEAFIDRCEVDWHSSLAPLLTPEQDEQFPDEFWRIYTTLADTGQLQSLTEAWERRQRHE